jgi:hypothetical protein
MARCADGCAYLQNLADVLAAVDLEEHLTRLVERMRGELVQLEHELDEAVLVGEERGPLRGRLRFEDRL